MAENKERYCSNCKHEYNPASVYPCIECCNAYTSKFESKTNFDRIKEMSVDELAKFISTIYDDEYDCNLLHIGGELIPDTAIKIWLESEARNND